RRLELQGLSVGKPQCVHEPLQGVGVGAVNDVALQIADGPSADLSAFGQLLLGQPRRRAVPLEELRKGDLECPSRPYHAILPDLQCITVRRVSYSTRVV